MSESQVKCIDTSGMETYPEYKDSGVEWIGKIPKEWDIVRINHVAQVIDPQPDHRAPPLAKKTEEEYPYIGIRDVNHDGTINTQTARQIGEQAVIKQEKSFRVENGDIVFCKVGTLGYPRHIKPKGRFALSATLVLIKCREFINCNYLQYALSGKSTYFQTDLLSTGSTRRALGIEQIRKMLVCYPPFPEQQTISNFLDRETSRIDGLVGKKQYIIELLEEKRSALISHTVTKGLNPDVPMKDLDIEWIGGIPEEWDVTKLKHLVDLRTKKANDGRNYSTKIALENIESFTGKLLDPYSDFEGDGTIIKEGDVLFNKLRPYLCKAVIAPSEGIAVGELLVFRIQETILDSKFLLYRILSHEFISLVNGSTYGTKMPRASWEFIKNIEIPVPSLLEQQAIASYLDRETVQIDTLIEKIKQSIEYLKEYRTALISDAVTGKIDVRGTACE